MGMIVTAFTTSMDRKEELMKLGASNVLNSENIE
jgi:D-arabinose 1-dehydrogenase-like Zn-dependent alcohol dehydrogenase